MKVMPQFFLTLILASTPIAFGTFSGAEAKDLFVQMEIDEEELPDDDSGDDTEGGDNETVGQSPVKSTAPNPAINNNQKQPRNTPETSPQPTASKQMEPPQPTQVEPPTPMAEQHQISESAPTIPPEMPPKSVKFQKVGQPQKAADKAQMKEKAKAQSPAKTLGKSKLKTKSKAQITSPVKSKSTASAKKSVKDWRMAKTHTNAKAKSHWSPKARAHMMANAKPLARHRHPASTSRKIASPTNNSKAWTLRTVKSDCNIRQKPNKNSKIVGKLFSGKKITVKPSQNNWFQMTHKSKTAYVSSVCF